MRFARCASGTDLAAAASRPVPLTGQTVASARLILAFGLIVAFVLRLTLAMAGGNEWDLDIYKGWAALIAERGAVHAYDGSVIVDYPPIFLYWLDLGGRLIRSIAPNLDPTLFIRLPGLVLDLVVGTVIYVFVERRGGARWALVVAFAYLFNPAVVFDLAFWGMPDSPHSLLILAAIWLAISKRPFLAWLVITIGVFAKPQADLFAPMVALITLRDSGWRACLWGIAGIAAGLVIAVGPFAVAGTLGGVLNQQLSAAEYDPFLSNNAHNLWWLVGWGYAWQIRDTEPFIGPISYRLAGIALFLSAYGLALWRLWRRPDQTWEIAAYGAMALFMLLTVIHETHLYTVFPLLSLIWWRDRRRGWLYLALSTTFFLNLSLHDTQIYERLQSVGLHRQLLGLAMANAVVMLAIFGWWTLQIGGITVRRLAPLSAAVAAAAVTAFAFSPRVISASYDPAHIGTASGAEFGGQIRLVGYSMAPERAMPGDSVRFTFTWQALRDVDTNYMLFVHLVSGSASAGQQDGPPTRNLYPTRLWRAGEVVSDERTVKVPAGAEPGVYTAEIGFYPLTDFRRLPVVANGSTDNRLDLGKIVVPVGRQPVSNARTLDYRFGKIATLAATTVEVRDRTVDLQLVWVAQERTTIDYTVFVQLIGPAGVVAQKDSQPRGGTYPTSIWLPGETIVHPARLVIPPGVPSGTYRLIAGLYDLSTGKRLAGPAGDSADLGTVEVRP